jgi:hypothetical protein
MPKTICQNLVLGIDYLSNPLVRTALEQTQSSFLEQTQGSFLVLGPSASASATAAAAAAAAAKTLACRLCTPLRLDLTAHA